MKNKLQVLKSNNNLGAEFGTMIKIILRLLTFILYIFLFYLICSNVLFNQCIYII